MVGRLTRLPFCVGKATKVKQDPRKTTNRSETIQNIRSVILKQEESFLAFESYQPWGRLQASRLPGKSDERL